MEKELLTLLLEFRDSPAGKHPNSYNLITFGNWLYERAEEPKPTDDMETAYERAKQKGNEWKPTDTTRDLPNKKNKAGGTSEKRCGMQSPSSDNRLKELEEEFVKQYAPVDGVTIAPEINNYRRRYWATTAIWNWILSHAREIGEYGTN